MDSLLLMLLTWPVVGVVVKSGSGGVGIALAYVVGLSLIHFFGAGIYLNSTYAFNNLDLLLDGFRLSTYGLWAFCLGVLIFRYSYRSKAYVVNAGGEVKHSRAGNVDYLKQSAKYFLGFGLFIQFIVSPLLGQVATFSTIILGITNLTLVGVCLGARSALISQDRGLLLSWVLIAFMFPIISLINGFMGYGVHQLVIFLAFIFVFIPLKKVHYLALVVLVYLGLSIFVTYFEGRTEYRGIAWKQEAGVEQKLNKLGQMFSDFEFFDYENNDHLDSVNIRLNQNILVGQAYRYLRNGSIEYAEGKTILFSILALIPRAVWPDKPSVGGGGDIVSKYTGINFASGTSVGAGQVLEFYVNFGTIGVVVGFFVLGVLIAMFDYNAGVALRTENFRGFILWFLPGIGFLQAGGNLVEITTTVGAAVGSAYLIVNVLNRRILRGKRQNSRR